jgi:hypothetical protein
MNPSALTGKKTSRRAERGAEDFTKKNQMAPAEIRIETRSRTCPSGAENTITFRFSNNTKEDESCGLRSKTRS